VLAIISQIGIIARVGIPNSNFSSVSMPKSVDPVTGQPAVDCSIQDIANALFRTAKEMRGLVVVAANVTLWDTTRQGGIVPATVAKNGHHPLVRILIEQAREYERWKALDEAAEMSDADDALAQRIQVAKSRQRALADLRDTALKIQSMGQDSMTKANDLITKLTAMKQQMQMHREKLGKELDDADDAELLVLADLGEPSGVPGELEPLLETEK